MPRSIADIEAGLQRMAENNRRLHEAAVVARETKAQAEPAVQPRAVTIVRPQPPSVVETKR